MLSVATGVGAGLARVELAVVREEDAEAEEDERAAEVGPAADEEVVVELGRPAEPVVEELGNC